VGDTLLCGGQDVQQSGYYFDEAQREVRCWSRGQTLAHRRQGDHWRFLTEDRDRSRGELERLIHERGYGGPLEGLRSVAPEPASARGTCPLPQARQHDREPRTQRAPSVRSTHSPRQRSPEACSSEIR
jgi:hypothetical protein